MKKAYIDINNCSGCSLCIENCPFDCLELTKPKFHGDINTYAYLLKIDKCIGCGICKKACPIKAITLIE